MPYPVGLVNLNAAELAAHSGGDPWKINDELQSGKPGAINDLADAFHNAAVCTVEMDDDFNRAKNKFELGFRRNESEHPINDSAEVARATEQMHLQKIQIGKIAIDMENVAAALANAQLDSDCGIGVLDANLNVIDDHISRAKAAGQDAQPLYDEAIGRAKDALKAVTEIRDRYKAVLADSITAMRLDGYDPEVLSGIEGDGQQSAADYDRVGVNKYDETQRERDHALVNSGGPMTMEKAAAAARLRDDATAHNASADSSSRHLASERLDDFNKSQTVGPLPTDPILGGDARTRAQMRLAMQQKLESGAFGPKMTADQATQALDNAEQEARVITTQQAARALQSQGLSAEGARHVVDQVAEGKSLKDVISTSSTFIGAGGSSADAAGRVVEGGLGHVGYYTESDVKALEGISQKLGHAALGVDSVLAAYDVVFEHAPVGEKAGEVAGNWAAGYLSGVGAWALAGETVGPEGAAALGLVGALVLSPPMSKLGGYLGGMLDGH